MLLKCNLFKMWQVISPISSCSSEPIELRRLKDQIANNSCKCKICLANERSMQAMTSHENKETQINDIKSSLSNIPMNNRNCGNKENSFCPGCSMVFHFMQKEKPKILKDEELETNQKMFTSDKSTEKSVISLEKTTSMTCKFSPTPSYVTFCDTITDYSTDISVYPVPSLRRHNQVTFAQDPIEYKEKHHGTCLCMENFINSIRPPLLGCME